MAEQEAGFVGSLPSIKFNVLEEDVTFRTRVRDDSVGGVNPYRWQDVTIKELMANRRILIVTLPGAFTPTCTTRQVPEYEENYEKVKEVANIDEIYIMAMNDAYVMNAWAKSLGVEKLKMLPDGNGSLTRRLMLDYGMHKEGMGVRCRRSALFFSNGVLLNRWVEDVPDRGSDDPDKQDPYTFSSPENVIVTFERAAEMAAEQE
tara:strand:+ start:180 stop:791 length:612 start_codon:yes stop_codon:yes gene_type:complete